MSVGETTAASCWLAILAAGTAAITFGLSNDSNSGLRDAVLELKLLVDGPTPEFREHCRQFAERRERGIVIPDRPQTKEDWVRGFQSIAPHLADNFEVKGLLWCPFPPQTMTVRDAIDLVNNADNNALLLWPHSTFLNALGAAISDPPSVEDITSPRKFGYLAREIASGTKKLSSMEVTSDPKAGAHTMFECASSAGIFDPNARIVPTSPLQIIVSTTSGAMCFGSSDVPKSVVRLVGSHGFQHLGFHSAYFASRIALDSGYSRKSEVKVGIFDLPKERQGIPDKNGVVQLNEFRGFDFPAVRSSMREIGGLSIREAYDSLADKARDANDVLEVFGMKVPLVPFLLILGIGTPLLFLLFRSGLRQHGKAALPDVIQGLPPVIFWVVVVGIACTLPAVGSFALAFRTRLLFPNLVIPLYAFGIVYACISLPTLIAAARRPHLD